MRPLQSVSVQQGAVQTLLAHTFPAHSCPIVHDAPADFDPAGVSHACVTADGVPPTVTTSHWQVSLPEHAWSLQQGVVQLPEPGQSLAEPTHRPLWQSLLLSQSSPPPPLVTFGQVDRSPPNGWHVGTAASGNPQADPEPQPELPQQDLVGHVPPEQCATCGVTQKFPPAVG